MDHTNWYRNLQGALFGLGLFLFLNGLAEPLYAEGECSPETNYVQATTLDIALVIDGSSSISNTEFETALNGFSEAILELLPGNDVVRLSVIQFGGTLAGTAQLEIGPIALNEANRSTIASQLVSINKLNGETPTGDGIDKATEVMLRSGDLFGERQIILLSSDSAATTGEILPVEAKEAFLEEGGDVINVAAVRGGGRYFFSNIVHPAGSSVCCGEGWIYPTHREPDYANALAGCLEPVFDCSSESDCDGDGTYDICQLELCPDLDCNNNNVFDACDIANGTSFDIVPEDGDGAPDECEADCNNNEINDLQEIEADNSKDCDNNRILDSCELTTDAFSFDCNGNNIPDRCDLIGEIDIGSHWVSGADFPFGGRISQVAAADFDGNGLADVAAVSDERDPFIRIVWNDLSESGAWRASVTDIEPFGGASLPTIGGVAAADIDFDGDPDLLFTDSFGRAGIVRNHRQASSYRRGLEVEPTGYDVRGSVNDFRPRPVLGDIDGDGAVDAVFSDGRLSFDRDLSPQVSVLYGNFNQLGGVPGTSFHPQVHTLTAFPNMGATLFDSNGDQQLDIVLSPFWGGHLYAFEHIEPAADRRSRLFRPVVSAKNYPARPFFADLDRDGADDYIIGQWGGLLLDEDPDSSLRIVLSGVPQRTYEYRIGISPFFQPREAAAADFDGNGFLDVVVAAHDAFTGTNGALFVWKNLGNNSSGKWLGFQTPPKKFDEVDINGETEPAGGLWRVLTADLNNDSRPDIVAGSIDEGRWRGEVILYENRTTPPFSRDADRDGRPDECPIKWLFGDTDCSGAVNSADIDSFVIAIIGGADEYTSAYRACDFRRADINGSGEVNSIDIDSFIQLQVGSLNIVPGDTNCDAVVDNGDVAGFELALANRDDYVSEYPDCSAWSADTNQDLLINSGDIGEFQALLAD